MAEFTLSLNSESLSLLNKNEYHQLNDLEDLIDEYIDDNNHHKNNNNELNYYNNGFDYCNKKLNIWCDNNNNNIYHEFYPTAQTYDEDANNNDMLYDDIEKDTQEDYERYVPDYLDQNDQNEIIDDTVVEKHQQQHQQQQQQQLQQQFNFNATENLESNKTFDINNNNNKNNDQATKLIKNIENIKGLWDQPRVLFNRVLSMQFDGDDDFESPYFTQDESDQIENYLIEMSNKTN